MTKFSDPWGFSKLDCYRDCPQKFFYQFIKKMPQSGFACNGTWQSYS